MLIYHFSTIRRLRKVALCTFGHFRDNIKREKGSVIFPELFPYDKRHMFLPVFSTASRWDEDAFAFLNTPVPIFEREGSPLFS
jgi:hypothetical protein